MKQRKLIKSQNRLGSFIILIVKFLGKVLLVFFYFKHSEINLILNAMVKNLREM